MADESPLPIKDIIVKYFRETGKDVWQFHCGRTSKSGRAWSNLVNHIIRNHSNILDEVTQNCNMPLLHLCWKKDSNLFGRIE